MSPARLIAGLCLSIALISPGLVAAQETTPTDTQTPTTTTTETPTNDTAATSAGGEALNSSNYKAPQNADYAVMNLMHAALCQLAGMSPGQKCIANVSDGGTQLSLRLYDQVPGGGALGATSTLIAQLYTPPTSTARYVADIGRRVGFVQTANAQSVTQSAGGQVIEPVRTLWSFSQRIAYLAFTLIFLATGFMIMLRRKLNPQTVITVQNAVPGLVVGLIMVTFSYFICAFILDLSFIGVALVAGIFSQFPNAFGVISTTDLTAAQQAQNFEQLNRLATESNVFQLFGAAQHQVITRDVVSIFDATLDLNQALGPGVNIIGAVIGALVALVMAAFGPAGWIVGAGVAGGLAGGALPVTLSLLIPLILLIALFIQMLRLTFSLISTYISILISTIFGPLIILMSAIPGRGGTLWNWMKGLLVNSMIFPAVLAMFFFAGTILSTDVEAWNSSLPLFGQIPSAILRLVIAYGILLAIPSIPDTIRKSFKVDNNAAVGQAAMAGFIGGMNLGQSTVTRGYQRLWRGGAERGDAAAGALAIGVNRARGRTRTWFPSNPSDHRFDPRFPRGGWHYV